MLVMNLTIVHTLEKDMTKAYPEQLGEWIDRRPTSPRNKKFVAFLALREEIQAALDDGYFVKTIWENLYETKRTELGYQMFLHYVNRYLRRDSPKPRAPEIVAPKPPVARSAVSPMLKARTTGSTPSPSPAW